MCFLLCLPSGLLFVTSVFNQQPEKSADGITVPGGRETNWAFRWQRCPSLLPLFLLLFLRLSTQTIDSHSAFLSPHRSLQLMESSSDVPFSFILALSWLHRRSLEDPGGKMWNPPRPSADQIKPQSLTFHLILMVFIQIWINLVGVFPFSITKLTKLTLNTVYVTATWPLTVWFKHNQIRFYWNQVTDSNKWFIQSCNEIFFVPFHFK